MEEALVVMIVFGSIIAVVKLILDFQKEKHKARALSSGSSTTTSELKQLMREAVDEAIEERFGRLEKRLDKLETPRQLAAPVHHTEEMEVPAAPPVARDRDITR